MQPRKRGNVSAESPVTTRRQTNHHRHVLWMDFARSLMERVIPQLQPPRPEDSQLRSALYRVYLAQSEDERRAAFRLRFRTFNLELNEGLERAYETGEDTDEFDPFCDHLIVHDDSTGNV